MAIKEVKSCVDVYWVDNAAIINDNFQSTKSGFESVTMTTTPASGSCAVQFVFNDTEGVALAEIASGIGYVSADDGTSIAGATGVATLTNGAVTELVVGQVFHFITDVTGKLGVTVTAGDGSYYISFVLPNGKIITSGEIVVNA